MPDPVETQVAAIQRHIAETGSPGYGPSAISQPQYQAWLAQFQSGHAPLDAPPTMTIADEQRERAAEIERIGAAAWVEARDERSPEERQSRAVTGVAQPKIEASTG